MSRASAGGGLTPGGIQPDQELVDRSRRGRPATGDIQPEAVEGGGQLADLGQHIFAARAANPERDGPIGAGLDLPKSGLEAVGFGAYPGKREPCFEQPVGDDLGPIEVAGPVIVETGLDRGIQLGSQHDQGLGQRRGRANARFGIGYGRGILLAGARPAACGLQQSDDEEQSRNARERESSIGHESISALALGRLNTEGAVLR